MSRVMTSEMDFALLHNLRLRIRNAWASATKSLILTEMEMDAIDAVLGEREDAMFAASKDAIPTEVTK